jgi:hypothetical protein
MKILRFNEETEEVDYENYPIQNASKNLSGEINGYIDNFISTIDSDFFEWITSVADKTNVKEYKNLESPQLIKDKNLKIFDNYLVNQKRIAKTEKILDNLEKYKNKIYFDAINEVLYKFQEDLLDKDPDWFFSVFIEDYIDDQNIRDDESWDIHPDILKNHKDEIDLLLNAKKYNL